ncbi:hypothetical protein [Chitinophaga agri]|uniref:Uncharacterized protein n=1 Tax=Chitinophaga agri TaxID=2703787 RepID=A0A6B9ZI48_9BACT|nr:hypothetical protein [Chitinophaga agri]QHS60815.1 hypothetical protein GWR21_14785 [Chitinophaga agri]
MSKVITLNDWLNIQSTNKETDQRLFLIEDEIRSFKQFEDATAEELQNIIATLHSFALITYDLYCNGVKNDKLSSAA